MFLWTLLGIALVTVALVDIFYTVLFPGSGRGPVRRPLSSAMTGAFRLTRFLPLRWKSRAMAYCGPAHVGTTILAWFVLLLLGWAAIYRPALGTGVVAATGSTQRTWGTAIYYSGYTLTTLGLGDIVAVSPVYRVLTVVEAASGFISFTLVISYFVSVYTTLTARNSFALALHQRSGGTGRGAKVVQALWQEGPVAAGLHLAETASELRRLVQTDDSYPVLQSFHFQRDYRALPQILQTCWETVTLLRTTVSPTDSRPELHGSSVTEIVASTEAICARIGGRHSPAHSSTAQRADWSRQHARWVEHLRESGAPVAADCTDAYLDARTAWSADLDPVVEALLYEWPDEDPSGSCATTS